MLIRVGVDTAGVALITGEETAAAIGVTRRLLDVLLRHAVLCLASGDDRDELVRVVKELPQDARKLWTTAFQELVVRLVAPPARLTLAEVTTTKNLQDEWRGKIALAYVAPEKARSLGVADPEPSILDSESNIEIARLDLPEQAARVRRAIELSRQDIPKNALREDVWRERFASLAAVTKQVTILDRYAIPDLLDGKDRGLRWFLEQLDESGVTSVHLISQARSGQVPRAVNLLQAMRSGLPRGNIATLTLTLAEEGTFGAEAHARHARFRSAAVVMDRGLTMFRSRRCRQSTPCRPGDRRACREREAAVEASAIAGARRLVVW